MQTYFILQFFVCSSVKWQAFGYSDVCKLILFCNFSFVLQLNGKLLLYCFLQMETNLDDYFNHHSAMLDSSEEVWIVTLFASFLFVQCRFFQLTNMSTEYHVSGFRWNSFLSELNFHVFIPVLGLFYFINSD